MNYTCIYFIGHLRHHFPTNRIPDNINYIWSFLIFCQISVLQNYSFIHIFQLLTLDGKQGLIKLSQITHIAASADE